jgi:hypothetical protein
MRSYLPHKFNPTIRSQIVFNQYLKFEVSDGRTDGQTDERTDGRTDRQSDTIFFFDYIYVQFFVFIS